MKCAVFHLFVCFTTPYWLVLLRPLSWAYGTVAYGTGPNLLSTGRSFCSPMGELEMCLALEPMPVGDNYHLAGLAASASLLAASAGLCLACTLKRLCARRTRLLQPSNSQHRCCRRPIAWFRNLHVHNHTDGCDLVWTRNYHQQLEPPCLQVLRYGRLACPKLRTVFLLPLHVVTLPLRL